MRNDVKNFLQKVALGGALVAATIGAQAATQGTTGSTSTGTVDIQLLINGAVRISNLDNLDLGTFSGTGPMTDSDTACVYSNGATGYTVTATSSAPNTTPGAFVLADAAGTNTIPYTVAFDDLSGGGATTLGYNSASSMGNARTIDDNCFGVADNASVQVDVAAVDASAVPQGTYTSVLTLVVAPI